ncbi:MAG TPA: AI-2E family transporter [Thermomicrobiales bacterium]
MQQSTMPPEQHLPPPPAEPEPSGRRVGLTPVSLFLVLLIAYLLLKVQIVLILVLLAILFATIIERPVSELERRHVPRSLSILAVYVAILGTIGLGGLLLSPTISEEGRRFRAEVPSQLRDLRDEWRTSGNSLLRGAGVQALDRVIDIIERPTAPPEQYAIGIVTSIVGTVVGLISVFVMAFYYLMEKAFLRRVILQQMQEPTRSRVARTWDRVEAQVGRWMRGQLLLCLIIGVASTIGYGVLGLRFWPLLGLFAGITEAIPVVGPWIGGAPAVIIAMTMSWEKVFLTIAFVAVLQAAENWVLVPRVMRGAVGLTPLTVLIAILAGSTFMNVIGAFLAIPIAAAVQVIVADYLRTRRQADRQTDGQAAGWRWMLEHVAPPPVEEPEDSEPAPSASEAEGQADRSAWRENALSRLRVKPGRPRLPKAIASAGSRRPQRRGAPDLDTKQ